MALFGSTTQALTAMRRRLANAQTTNSVEPFDWEWEARRDRYAFNRAMLNNSAYDLTVDGGYRGQILADIFGVTASEQADIETQTRLLGYFNPIRTIVDAYKNVFRGSYGKEIKVADQVDGTDVNPRLVDPKVDPIGRIWRWSNLDTQKQFMQTTAANLGTVGIRIVARPNTNPAKRRVTLQFDHPGRIIDYNTDDRGNVTEIELRYTALAGDLGEKRFDAEVREVFTRELFIKEVNGRNVLEPDEQRNELGVCPYVILRHNDDENLEYGRWAYDGSEVIIHAINWLISNQADAIVDHNYATWFATAAGDPPVMFDVGKKKVAYVKTAPDSPNPSLEPLVAKLDNGGVREFWESLLEQFQGRQPEIVLGNIKALSGQSGETIAKLLLGTETRIEQAKGNYEHATIRAMQIAMSYGVMLGIWDLGTGTGSAEAADRAYESGKENFQFNDRPALPQSVYDKLNQVKLDTAERASNLVDAKAAAALGLPIEEQLKIAGYSEEDRKRLATAMKTTDVPPTESL